MTNNLTVSKIFFLWNTIEPLPTSAANDFRPVFDYSINQFCLIHLLQKLGVSLYRPNNFSYMAVVVAQLVERSLPIPEVRGSNPVIGKHLFIY